MRQFTISMSQNINVAKYENREVAITLSDEVGPDETFEKAYTRARTSVVKFLDREVQLVKKAQPDVASAPRAQRQVAAPRPAAPAAPVRQAAQTPQEDRPDGLASERQRKMLFAKAMTGAYTKDMYQDIVRTLGGVEDDRLLKRRDVDKIVAFIESNSPQTYQSKLYPEAQTPLRNEAPPADGAPMPKEEYSPQLDQDENLPF